MASRLGVDSSQLIVGFIDVKIVNPSHKVRPRGWYQSAMISTHAGVI